MIDPRQTMRFLTTFVLILLFTLTGYGSSNENSGNIQDDTQEKELPETSETVSDGSSTLSQEQKYALSYMWNEEKLAYDIYLALNEINPSTQLYNIPTRSEIRHIELVEKLVRAYDINITNTEDYTVDYSEEELGAMPTGTFAIPEIQELYDTLYAMGTPSLTASLEVGCIIEVTDVNDLDKYLIIAADKEDLVETFEILRAGSYNHYWAFDGGLKGIGITDGCCSLGDEYCKTEEDYPRP